jgi:hypothetical protein
MRLAVYSFMGQDSIVKMATCYGLGGSGIKSQWGVRLSAPIQTLHGARLSNTSARSLSYGKTTRAWY